MLANLIRPSDLTKLVIRVDPHSSHKSLFHNDKSVLAKHNVTLDIGREHNVNHNPVAEKAIRELIKEILILQPGGGPITSRLLSEATANLNSRIRAPGVSAHEIFTQRDQTTGHQLTLDDIKLIQDQNQRRILNHKSSEKCKSGGKSALPDAKVSVGSIVYIYSDGSKLRARPRYVVLSVKDGWCTVRRFAERQLGRVTYDIKLSECYVVPDETVDPHLPPYPTDHEQEEDVFIANPVPPPVKGIPPEEESEPEDESGGEEVDTDAKEDGDDEEEAEEEEEISHCSICHREVTKHHQGLICDSCDNWSHRNCLKITKKRYKEMTKTDDFQWTCPSCPPQPMVDEEPVKQ